MHFARRKKKNKKTSRKSEKGVDKMGGMMNTYVNRPDLVVMTEKEIKKKKLFKDNIEDRKSVV